MSTLNEKDEGFCGLAAFTGVAIAAAGLWALFKKDEKSTAQPLTSKCIQWSQQLFEEAVNLQQNGRFAEALSKAQECLAVNPNHAHAWNLVAWNHLLQNFNLEHAHEIARYAADIATSIPDKVQFLNTAAEVCVTLGWLDEAIFEFRRALKLSTIQEFPQPYTLLRLGQCYQIKQDFPTANVCLTQAKSLDTNNPNILLALGQLNLQMGHYIVAIKQYEAAMELATQIDIPIEARHQVDSNCLNDIGVAYFYTKDYERSRIAQEKAHSLCHTNPYPLINLVSLSALSHDQSQMRVYFERVIPLISMSQQAIFLIQGLLTDTALEEYRDMVLELLRNNGLISNEIYKQQMLFWNQRKQEALAMKENHMATSVTIHGDVGTFNQGTIVGSIESNIQKLGKEDIAQGFKEIKDQITLSNVFKSEQKTELLQTLNALSKQAILPEAQREKGVIRSLLCGLASSVAVGGGMAEMWSTWGPQLCRFFGVSL